MNPLCEPWVEEEPGRWDRQCQDSAGRQVQFEVREVDDGAVVTVYREQAAPPHHLWETSDTKHGGPWFPSVKRAQAYCDRRFASLLRRQQRAMARRNTRG